MNTTTEEKQAKKELLNKCWTYLRDNFHKFNDTNKIRVALELVKKDMPTQLEGEIGHRITQMPAVTIDGKPLEYDIGVDSTEDVVDTEEADTDNHESK